MYNKIFISHSSQDKAYGDAIVSLLLEIGLNPKQILYSSDSDCGIPIGCDIFEFLRSTIESDSTYMVYLLSENYYDSIACMNEMGAAWIQQKEFLMIAIPNFMFSDTRFQSGVANPRSLAVSMEDSARMRQFVERIVDLFQLSPGGIKIQKCLQDFFERLKNIPKTEQPIRCLESVVKQSCSTTTDFMTLGDKLREQSKNYPAAIQQYLYAIYLDENCLKAYTRLVETATLAQDYFRAEKASDKFIESFPESAEAYGSRGYLLCARKKYDEAISYCDKAISLKHDRWFYNTRGRALWAQSKLYEAMVDFREANKIAPEYKPAIRNLKKICGQIGIDEILNTAVQKKQQGNEDLCKVYLDCVLRIDKNNKKAKEILSGCS